MPQLITVYWRDIPAQVIAKERRTQEKVQLTDRFAEAIDAAAMRGGLVGTDAYLEEWRRESSTCGADLRAEADAAAEKLEADYDKERLMALMRNHGFEAGNEPAE